MIAEILQFILAPLSDYPYVVLFVGLLIVGEVVLLPAIYLAVTGRLDIGPVFAIAFAATMLSDAFWYYLGRYLPPERWARFAGERVGRAVQRFEVAFERHRGVILLFLSKFVYGTRTAVQVLAGVHAIPPMKWAAINALAILVLNTVLVTLGYLVRGTVVRLGEVVEDMELAFLAFVVVAIVAYVTANRVLARRWFQ